MPLSSVGWILLFFMSQSVNTCCIHIHTFSKTLYDQDENSEHNVILQSKSQRVCNDVNGSVSNLRKLFGHIL